MGKKLVRMMHGSLSPVYLESQCKWKKRLVKPIEMFLFLLSERVVATGPWEVEWARKWGLRCEIESVDLKQFFNLSSVECVGCVEGSPLHLLYMGRRHPLKGLEYLETAIRHLQESTRSTSSARLKQIELKVVSNAFGEEKERVWDWCDVLVLPTLSENFGLVVAEALERGKRVITTDGAPAWGENLSRVERVEYGEILSGYDGRLIYLKGFRDGTPEVRVKLLRSAIENLIK